MATGIEWCDETWNPVTGCSKISPACDNCYAERMSKRLAGRFGYPQDEPFRVTMHPEKLAQPLRWKKPRRIFVVSMGDLFHVDVPNNYIAAIFGVMAACPQHTFMVPTKRARGMKHWFDCVNGSEILEPWRICRNACVNTIPCGSSLIEELKQDIVDQQIMSGLDTWPLQNVWLGVTAEDQQRANERIPVLLSIPAAKRFVSCEPLLGPIDLRGYLWCESCGYSKRDQEIHWDHHLCSPELKILDWVIAGGETGPKARPMHPNWVRWLRDQCIGSHTHFFFKKWSGTQRNGRLLDDRTWNEMPDIERNP